jgi:hypothetical protein
MQRMAVHGQIRFRSPHHDEIQLYSTYPSASKPGYVLQSLDVIVRNVHQQLPVFMANALLFSEAAFTTYSAYNDVDQIDEWPKTTAERVYAAYQMSWKMSQSAGVTPLSRVYDVYVPREKYDEAFDTRASGEETVHVRFCDGYEEEVSWSEIEWDWNMKVVDAVEEFDV